MDFETLDENLGLLMAKLELEGEHCRLKHSKADPAENHPAVDYLCQKLGDQETGEVKQEIRIPVCKECAEALYDEDWILCYCTYCHESQWIYRPYSKVEHPEGNGIYFLDICPHCAVVEDTYDKEM
jgi:hypothetical protein